MPKVSASHLEARRRGILKAAFRCFVRNGLHATTIRDICRAANLSPGAVYGYFDSKQAIVEALAHDSRERMGEFLRSLADAERADDPVRALLDTLGRPEAVEQLRLDIALWAEALRSPDIHGVFAEAGAELSATLAGAVRRRQAAGLVDPDLDPRACGRLLLAVFDGLALQRAVEPELDLRPVAEMLSSMLRARGRAAPPG